MHQKVQKPVWLIGPRHLAVKSTATHSTMYFTHDWILNAHNYYLYGQLNHIFSILAEALSCCQKWVLPV